MRRIYQLKTIEIVCLILVIVTVCAGLFLLFRSKGVAAAFTSGSEMREVSQIIRSQQADLILHTHHTLGIISNMHPELEGCDEDLAGLLTQQESYITFAIADSTGQIICSAIPNRVKGNVSDRGYFRQSLETDRFTVGEYQINRVTNTPSINFAYPFESKAGEGTYVGIAVLSLEWLKRTVDQVNLPPGSELTIIDNRGVVLAQYSDGRIGHSAAELRYDMESVVQAARELAILKMRDRQGTIRYVAVAPVGIPEQEGLLHILLSVPENRVLPLGLGSVISAFD